jgi:hypothetical protein
MRAKRDEDWTAAFRHRDLYQPRGLGQTETGETTLYLVPTLPGAIPPDPPGTGIPHRETVPCSDSYLADRWRREKRGVGWEMLFFGNAKLFA